MFTGLIEEIGKILHVNRTAGSTDFKIGCSKVLSDLGIGDSVAINGVCLTATSIGADYYTATATLETLQRTTLGELDLQSFVNLERSLTLQSRLGGHIVQGHVDGTGQATAMEVEGDSQRWTFEVPLNLLQQIIMKGSITVNGVSLTVAGLDDRSFSVALIPKTIEMTTFQYMKPGDRVNLETDMVGKYVFRYMESINA